MKLLWVLLLTLSLVILHAWAKQKKCGKHLCAAGAFCKDNYCHCKGHGRGDFFCYNEKKDVCYLIKDPHLVNYENEKGFFPLPCRYHITHMKTKSKCDIQVFGSTALKNKVDAFEVSTEVQIFVGTKRGRIVLDEENSEYFIIKPDVSKQVIGKKGQYQLQLGEVTFSVEYESKRDAWMVNSTSCGFRVMFRPPIRSKSGDFSKQIRVPGVVVMNSKDGATFEYTDSLFPDALCSAPRKPGLMRKYQEKHKLNSINLAILHGWLSSGLEQGSRHSCQGLMDSFISVCRTPQQKTNAVNVCGPMFDNNHGRNRACFNKDDRIVDYFKNCLIAVCRQGLAGTCKLAAQFINYGCRLEGLETDCPDLPPFEE